MMPAGALEAMPERTGMPGLHLPDGPLIEMV
jgi:hypothetical protein